MATSTLVRPSFRVRRLWPETWIRAQRLRCVEPLTTPLEVVDSAGVNRAAGADALVVAAWTAHHAEIFAFLVRTTRDTVVAEDLLQEAFLRLTRETRAGRAPDNVRAWLYRVGANLATSRGRRVSCALRALVRIGSSGGTTRLDDAPETGYLQREGRAALVGALADLSPDARAALLMSSEGFSGAEIAAAIGRSDAATRTLLCRTRVLVRSHLEMAETSR